MKTVIIFAVIFAMFYYWDKGFGDFVEGNFKQMETKTLNWMKEHTPK